jgi:carbohydrate-selective porin OprB
MVRIFAIATRSVRAKSRRARLADSIRRRRLVTTFTPGLLLVAAAVSSPAKAQVPTPDSSGDFLTRSTFTGDWGGARNDLAKKGVTFDIFMTQVWQGVL